MAAKSRKNPQKSAARRIALPVSIALAAVAGITAAILAILHFSGSHDPPANSDPPYYAPYVDAPGLDSVTVADADIDEAYADLIAEIRLSEAEYAPAEPGYTAAMFDRLTFAYTGVPVDVQVSDALLSALTGQTTAVIGSDSLYPAYAHPDDPALSTLGFEEQLMGAAAGQTLEVLVTYPTDQTAAGVDVAPIQGKRIRFTLEILTVEKATLPDLSDELIARYTGGEFQSVEDFRADADSRIRAEYAYLALYRAVSVKSFPPELLDAESVRYIRNTVLSEYDISTLTDEQIGEIYDQLRDESLEYAQNALRDRMINDYLCDFAGITLSEDEYAAALAADFADNAIAYSYLGITDTAGMEEHFGKDNLFTGYRVDRLMKTVQRLVTFR